MATGRLYNLALTDYPTVDGVFAYLGSLGYTGSLNDRWMQYFAAQGYTTGTIDDRYKASLANPYTVYAANGFTPEVIADFSTETYRDNAGNTAFDDMFTYTGASLKTMVDSDGALKWAPHNLLLYSEQFDNAYWGATGSTVTANAATDPDGDTVADELLETVTTGEHRVFRSAMPALPARATHTAEVLVKNSAGSRNAIFYYGNAGGYQVYVDLSDGSIVSQSTFGAGATGSASVTDKGDGWYLIALSLTAGSAHIAAPFISVGLASGTSNSYTGDGTSKIFVSKIRLYRSDLGGMVNNPNTGDSYVKTSGSVVYMPRRNSHVHNGTSWVNRGILLESEARTNLLLNSGTLSTQNVTTSATPYTLSFSGTGTVTLSGTSTAGPLVGTGAGEENRVNLTFTPTAGTLTLTVTGTVTNAQLEAGSTPSSYIPTSGATATRAAETLTIAAANMAYDATAMSFAMDGLINYADEGAAAQQTFFRWQADASNYINIDLDTDSTATGEVNANQAASGTLDTVVAAAEYSPGVNVAFNIASRNTSGAINVAKDGTAATEDATPTALASLGSTAFAAGYDYMGHISTFRQWAADIGDTGIEEASA